jgi:Asp-tRNA(Asn)/Glu-tRNA(Gln) amidotransferase C subunit
MFEKTLAEKILKEIRKELQARIELAKEELERYSEQLNAVNKALEELKQVTLSKRKKIRLNRVRGTIS